MTRILVDTGPLVALFNRRDQHHEWTKRQFSWMRPSLFTCESVLTEASYLIHRNGGDSADLLQKVNDGVLEVGLHINADSAAIEKLMRTYANIPMSLADACLVRMSELHRDSKLFTMDSDFRIYRRSGRQTIPLIIPNEQ